MRTGRAGKNDAIGESVSDLRSDFFFFLSVLFVVLMFSSEGWLVSEVGFDLTGSVGGDPAWRHVPIGRTLPSQVIASLWSPFSERGALFSLDWEMNCLRTV